MINKAKPNNIQHQKNTRTLFDRISKQIYFIIFIVFIIFLFMGSMNFIEQQKLETQRKMDNAEKAFVDGRYDDAQKLANNINESYAKMMMVAIEEVKRGISQNLSKPVTSLQQPSNNNMVYIAK